MDIASYFFRIGMNWKRERRKCIRKLLQGNKILPLSINGQGPKHLRETHNSHVGRCRHLAKIDADLVIAVKDLWDLQKDLLTE